MASQSINVTIPDQMLEKLTRVKEKTGYTISDIVRRGLEKYFKEIEEDLPKMPLIREG